MWWPSPPQKPDGALDKKAIKWAAPDFEHPDFEDCSSQPLTAKALAAKRLRVDREAAAEEEEAPCITELDVWPIVVRHNMRNTADDETAHLQLKAWAKQHGTARMQKFLFKIRSRLPALIDDIWEWEQVEQSLPFAQMSRMDALGAASQAGCSCGGQWADIVKKSFDANNINVEALCSDILAALQQGRGATTPVIVLAGVRGGEGKSVLLKALLAVFGVSHVFLTPEQPNFALLGLPGKKVIFLDEWRFNNAIISFQAQMQLFDGSHMTVSRPQNVQGRTGHLTYAGTAPIFATTKIADLNALAKLAQDDPKTGQPICAEASMMMRRLRVYNFHTKIAKPAQFAPYCACCFAKLVLSRGVAADHGLWEAQTTFFL